MGSSNSKEQACTGKFTENENHILKAAYKELASRSKSHKTIDKVTFLKFFPLPGMHGERLFKVFDVKGNGVIEYEEFIKGLSVWCRGSLDDKIRFVFKLYDMNCDNHVSREELRTMLMHIPANALKSLGSHLDESSVERVLSCVSCQGVDIAKNKVDAPLPQHEQDTQSDVSDINEEHQVLPTPTTIKIESTCIRNQEINTEAVIDHTEEDHFATKSTTSIPSEQIPTENHANLEQPIHSNTELSNSNRDTIEQQLTPANNDVPITLDTLNTQPSNLENTTQQLSNSIIQDSPILEHGSKVNASVQQKTPQTLDSIPSTHWNDVVFVAVVEELVAQAFGSAEDLSYEKFKTWVKTTPEVVAFLERLFPILPENGCSDSAQSNTSPSACTESKSSKKSFLPPKLTRSFSNSSQRLTTAVLQSPLPFKLKPQTNNNAIIASKHGFTLKPSNPDFSRSVPDFQSNTFTNISKQDAINRAQLGKNRTKTPPPNFQFNGTRDQIPNSTSCSSFRTACDSVSRISDGGDWTDGRDDMESNASRFSEASADWHSTVNEDHSFDDNVEAGHIFDTIQGETMQGTLIKFGKRFHQTTSRWFVLAPNDQFLYYYHHQQDVRPAGVIFLEGCFVERIAGIGHPHSSISGISKIARTGRKQFQESAVSMIKHGASPARRSKSVDERDKHSKHAMPQSHGQHQMSHKSLYGLRILPPGEGEVRELYARTILERDSWFEAIKRATLVKDFFEYYEMGHEIGVGRYSKVFTCKRKTGKYEEPFVNWSIGDEITDDKPQTKKVIDPTYMRAVKIVDKSNLVETEKELLRNEIAILRLVNQKNIVKILDHFESRDKIYIVMDRMVGGELYERVVGRSCLTEMEAYYVIKALVTGISYLHSLGVVHRDIKPENILCGENFWDIKITDFGLSKLTTPEELMVLPCGTLSYVAPEVLNTGLGKQISSGSNGQSSNSSGSSSSNVKRHNGLHKKKESPSNGADVSRYSLGYGKEADLWSVGVILYLLVAGRLPFKGRTKKDTIELICGLDLLWDVPPFSKLSNELRMLLSGLLIKDPKKRLSAKQVLHHPWMEMMEAKASTGELVVI